MQVGNPLAQFFDCGLEGGVVAVNLGLELFPDIRVCLSALVGVVLQIYLKSVIQFRNLAQEVGPFFFVNSFDFFQDGGFLPVERGFSVNFILEVPLRLLHFFAERRDIRVIRPVPGGEDPLEHCPDLFGIGHFDYRCLDLGNCFAIGEKYG